MTNSMQKLKALFEAEPIRETSQVWMSRQAHYRAAYVVRLLNLRKAIKIDEAVKAIEHFRSREYII